MTPTQRVILELVDERDRLIVRLGQIDRAIEGLNALAQGAVLHTIKLHPTDCRCTMCAPA